MIPQAILFDFDGVLLDSVDIKTEAMRQLFADESPANVESIVALHQRHGGVNRFRKFEMIYADILRRPLTDEASAALGGRFEQLVIDGVLACREIAGARKVLENYTRKSLLFVVSGTPEDELKRIAAARDLASFFVSLRGSPSTKPEIVGELIQMRGLDPARCVFVGDSTTDIDAARAHDMPFIGVVAASHQNPFEAMVPVVPDLTVFDEALRKLMLPEKKRIDA